MSFLCKLGIHDWEIVETKRLVDTLNSVLREEDAEDISVEFICIEEFNNGVFDHSGNPTTLKEKVCLKCQKHVDRIYIVREKFRKEVKEKKHKIEKAKQISHNKKDLINVLYDPEN